MPSETHAATQARLTSDSSQRPRQSAAQTWNSGTVPGYSGWESVKCIAPVALLHSDGWTNGTIRPYSYQTRDLLTHCANASYGTSGISTTSTPSITSLTQV